MMLPYTSVFAVTVAILVGSGSVVEAPPPPPPLGKILHNPHMSCPSMSSLTAGICIENCKDCRSKNQFCCSNGCGHQCMVPVGPEHVHPPTPKQCGTGLMCKMYCPYGQVIDHRGCTLCECNEAPNTCPHGATTVMPRTECSHDRPCKVGDCLRNTGKKDYCCKGMGPSPGLCQPEPVNPKIYCFYYDEKCNEYNKPCVKGERCCEVRCGTACIKPGNKPADSPPK